MDSLPWHNGVVADYFGGGVPGFGAVFLFEIVSFRENVDKLIWIVAGDIPFAYFVTDKAPNWVCAFKVYSGLAQDWVAADAASREAEKVFPFQKTANPVSSDGEILEIIRRINKEILLPNKDMITL